MIGLTQSFLGDSAHVPFDPKAFDGSLESGGSLGIFLLLKGFSSGAVALTGVEAISNGVPAFRRPESKNAATTLVWMGVLLGSLFLGVSVLAHHLQPYPSHDQTVMAQMGLAVFGNGPAFVLLQFATAAILTLAANTAYNGFPSLSSIIAKDGYLPRQLAHRGDRLVFSNGIIVLAAAAAALLIAFNGITNALIPLYAVGVFTSFTLSQWGMTRHHRRLQKPGWRRNVALNATGAVATLAVLLIVATTKFTSGAWIPLVVIPLIVLLFKAIKSHYDAVGARPEGAARLGAAAPTPRRGDPRAAGRHRAASEAVAYAAIDLARPDGGGHRGGRRRRSRAGREALARRGRRCTARDRPRTRRRLHHRDAPVHRRARTALARDDGHRAHPRALRHPLVGAPAPQPERAPAEGAAALPREHRGDVDPVRRRYPSS